LDELMHSGGTKGLLCAPQLGRLWSAQSPKKLAVFRFKQRKEKVMKNSQQGFIKVRSGLTAFCFEMTGLVNTGRAQCQFTLTFASLLIQSHINPSSQIGKTGFEWEDYRVETGPALSGTLMTSEDLPPP